MHRETGAVAACQVDRFLPSAEQSFSYSLLPVDFHRCGACSPHLPFGKGKRAIYATMTDPREELHIGR